MSGRPRWIYGRHVVEETLNSDRCMALELCMLSDSGPEPGAARRARERGVKVRKVTRAELDRLCGASAHQGLALKVVDIPAGSLDDFLSGLKGAERDRAVLVALDQIQDPHNFGAIARSAACLGARALIAPERRSAPLSQAVLSSSAGAVQKLPVFQVVNLAQTLERLKQAGFWIYGADAAGKRAWDVRLNTPLVLVVGSEGQGIRPLVRSCCDELVAIPQAPGGVESLNASCAASVLLYEVARQAR